MLNRTVFGRCTQARDVPTIWSGSRGASFADLCGGGGSSTGSQFLTEETTGFCTFTARFSFSLPACFTLIHCSFAQTSVSTLPSVKLSSV